MKCKVGGRKYFNLILQVKALEHVPVLHAPLVFLAYQDAHLPASPSDLRKEEGEILTLSFHASNAPYFALHDSLRDTGP